jgi:hypothetical protein
MMANDTKAAEEKDEAERTLKETLEQDALPYVWRQTLTDIDITIPAVNVSSKQIKFVLKKSHISVTVAGVEVMVGDLYNSVKCDECTWLTDKKELTVHLEKVNGMEWWPHVITSAPKV